MDAMLTAGRMLGLFPRGVQIRRQLLVQVSAVYEGPPLEPAAQPDPAHLSTRVYVSLADADGKGSLSGLVGEGGTFDQAFDALKDRLMAEVDRRYEVVRCQLARGYGEQGGATLNQLPGGRDPA